MRWFKDLCSNQHKPTAVTCEHSQQGLTWSMRVQRLLQRPPAQRCAIAALTTGGTTAVRTPGRETDLACSLYAQTGSGARPALVSKRGGGLTPHPIQSRDQEQAGANLSPRAPSRRVARQRYLTCMYVCT
jgi:hypothetical protein